MSNNFVKLNTAVENSLKIHQAFSLRFEKYLFVIDFLILNLKFEIKKYPFM